MGMPLRVGAKEFLTISEAAKRFGIGRPTLQKAIRQGKLKTTKVGPVKMLSLSDVQAWMQTGYDKNHAERIRMRWAKSKCVGQNQKVEAPTGKSKEEKGGEGEE